MSTSRPERDNLVVSRRGRGSDRTFASQNTNTNWPELGRTKGSTGKKFECLADRIQREQKNSLALP